MVPVGRLAHFCPPFCARTTKNRVKGAAGHFTQMEVFLYNANPFVCHIVVMRATEPPGDDDRGPAVARQRRQPIPRRPLVIPVGIGGLPGAAARIRLGEPDDPRQISNRARSRIWPAVRQTVLASRARRPRMNRLSTISKEEVHALYLLRTGQ